MVGKIKNELIKNESEFQSWFEKNHKKLGYDKIIRGDIGKFPDFIMLKNDKEFKVELETELSNFLLHKHDINKVDEIICIKNNLKKDILTKPIIEIKNLEYTPRQTRVSATIDQETNKMLNEFFKNSRFRNKSHLIEEAILKYIDENGKKK
ncbi:MAG: hypothetical protein AABW91_02325 [Nanoarchaeota archaeon]